MSRILFTVPPFTGHVNPTLGLGAELIKKGHTVAWCCFDPDIERKIPENGIYYLLASDVDNSEKDKVKRKISSLEKVRVYGLDSLEFLYKEVLIPMNLGIIDAIDKLINEFRPDIIINDQQVFAGAVAAYKRKIPYISSVTAPAAIKVNKSLPMVYKWEGEQIISFQKKCGIQKNIRLDCSSLLTLVYTSKPFFGDHDLPEYYKFVGPVINRNEQDATYDYDSFIIKKEEPTILVTIGTTFNHSLKKEFFEKVFDAFRNENLSVILISDPDLFENIPSNFSIHKRIPQLKIMPYIDAVVCHGGHNTVCEALFNGKPLVVLPIAYDQSYVAGCIVESGSGIRLNSNRFNSDQLRSAVYEILTIPHYKANAEYIKKSFVEAGGVKKAINCIEEIIA